MNSLDNEIKVLVAEDEEITRLMISEWISSWGYTVETFPSGDAAFERLQEPDAPRIAVLDWVMPGKTGVDICGALQNKRPQIYFIILTSKSSEKDYSHALEDGAHAFQTKPVSPAVLKSQVQMVHRLLDAEYELLRQEMEVRLKCYGALANLAETRDDLTGTHMRRIGLFSKMLAEDMGESSTFCNDIEVFAPLHDIGKVGIPDTILLKPRGLTPLEREIMKGHTTMGGSILTDVPTMETGAVIARSHHERWDGQGYPDGISGDKIPLQARIVSLVDVYDALRSKRPYKDPWSHEEALNLIKEERGKQFDPGLVDLFEKRAEDIRQLRLEHGDEDVPGTWKF